MKKYNENLKLTTLGFTLVELLAVIVILAIILVIAVPKVMTIIEDTKKATLESTVKMIASSAEKAKVQNTVLGTAEIITCENVTNINDVDYERCIIEFDSNNKAKVTMKGTNKFSNLNVCNGDKTNAIASDETCIVEYGNATTYIEKLEAFNSSENGLIIDDTKDENIRYSGSNPNNYVYFNCKDVDGNNINYGSINYNYSDSCEIWRIIGIFDVDNGSGKIEKRIKIIREESIGKMSVDSSDISVNNGYGINQWGKSTYEDGTLYEGSDLMRLLNGYYIGNEENCRYCVRENQSQCENDCTSKITSLSKMSLNLIDDALWYLGANKWNNIQPLLLIYNAERDTQNSKICAATSSNKGEPQCNDQVTRTTSWVGKIGLIYPSDYGYASFDSNCPDDILGENSTCLNNNWLHADYIYWTITPRANEVSSTGIWCISKAANVNGYNVRSSIDVRPSLYLASKVRIIDGDGSIESPYKLA